MILTGFAIAVMVLMFSSQGNAGDEITGKVVGISDGDTITVLQNKTQYKIRLFGVDTPESHQDFGTKAKQFTSDMVFKKEVRVIPEATDRYGRTVGTVFVGTVCLNEELVRSGFAWVYRQYCTKAECQNWLKLETEAKNGKKGLWAGKTTKAQEEAIKKLFSSGETNLTQRSFDELPPEVAMAASPGSIIYEVGNSEPPLGKPDYGDTPPPPSTPGTPVFPFEVPKSEYVSGYGLPAELLAQYGNLESAQRDRAMDNQFKMANYLREISKDAGEGGLDVSKLAQLYGVKSSVFAGDEITGKVVGISDGDTITVLQNKTQYKIRLFGVDTPESHQDFGTRAKQFTADMAFKKEVRVIPETTDRYGRTVGTVFIGTVCLNEELVRSGFAWVYRQYCTKPECQNWLKLETEAKNGKKGLWAGKDPIPPWTD